MSSVPLGEVLTLDMDRVTVDPSESYPIAGVYGFGRGVFAREPISGADTSYRTLNRLKAGQLVVSRLKAFEGAVAIVPGELDGFFVSQEFPTFKIDERAALPEYVHFVCQWPDFWSMLAATSKGLGARRERVHPEQLFAVTIPLPDLAEQRRIVSRLEAIIGNAERVAKLTRHADDLQRALAASTSRSDAQRVAVGEVVEQIRRQETVAPDREYALLGARWYAEGLFIRERRLGLDVAATKLFRIESGDFVYNRLFAWKGAFAVAGEAEAGCYVSNEFPSFLVDEHRIDGRYLLALFSDPLMWEAARARSAGGTPTSRNRLAERNFLALEIPLRPLEEQKRLAALVDRIREISTNRREQIRRADALAQSTLNVAFRNGQ